MEMKMNLSEHIRCTEIIDYIFGSLIPKVNEEFIKLNLDLIIVKPLDDDLIDIKTTCQFLEEVEAKCNVKIVHPFIIGFKL